MGNCCEGSNPSVSAIEKYSISRVEYYRKFLVYLLRIFLCPKKFLLAKNTGRGVEEVLKEYERKDNRDCMVLFLTGSYPSLDTPNEVGYFNYLKEEYSYLTINEIQYGMGSEVISPVKKISDTQYYVDETVEENMLKKASISTVEYDQFEV